MKATSLLRAALAILAVLPPTLKAASKPSRFQIEEATIDGIQVEILKGHLTSTQVVQMYLQRIKAYDGPCVNQPEGPLGPFTTIKHAGAINSTITVNLRRATRVAFGSDAHNARTMTDPPGTNPDVPDPPEVAARHDAA